VHDDQPQSVYDGFNEFIFSSDSKLFNKLAFKIMVVNSMQDIPGDIVELGVFKGSGMLGWLKALQYNRITNKNVIGFDFFDYKANVDQLKGLQKEMMTALFVERDFSEKQDNYEHLLRAIIENAGFNNYDVVKGDVIETVTKYVHDNPGFRTSIVNFDLDVDEPTYACLNNLWDRLVPGGMFIFDEYGINQWTESDAVDRFCNEKGLSLISTQIFAPSAYVVKP
jgi:hypothetical protein